jgi:monofunctional biosynthetic peptidoglycan transglycosylase
MKKYLYGGFVLLLAYLGYIALSLVFLPPVANLKDRKATTTIQVKDWQGKYHDFRVGPKNRYWTPGGSIPAEMKWAVVLAEDSNFYRHEGVDVKAIKEAIKHDLEKKSFARGASTLTQQLAKNLYLSREKTITRKLKEVYLAMRMEQELTKGRIMELYLNVVELGPMVYGIGHASRYYFGKPATELSPREAAFLAAMLPGPRVAYNPYRNMNKVLKRSDMILKLLRSKRVLSEEEYRAAVASAPNINGLQRKVDESIKKEEVFPNRSSAMVVPAAGDKPVDEGVKAPQEGGTVTDRPPQAEKEGGTTVTNPEPPQKEPR